ncbi:uncharacterized protein IWZ02DRAFT_432644 [Phyllosticta citriasiana]|uniref:SnoaL-like domain-containing protein n=1 Tax=Phyllosticta citriasiana TaxID=595635 RepID=A0ABR1KRC5_9PEZI
MAPKYPSPEEIKAIFEPMEEGQAEEVIKRVHPDVDWTVVETPNALCRCPVSLLTERGKGTHPIAGRYTSLKDFSNNTLRRLLAKMKSDRPVRIKTRNVIGGGDSEWTIVELTRMVWSAKMVIRTETESLGGSADMVAGLKFENTYAWCMLFIEEGQIVQVCAYLDSALIRQVLEENEGSVVKSYRAPIV